MVSIYSTDRGVEEYVAMCEGQDGRALIDRLCQLIPVGSKVLELGSGPGIDLLILAEFFSVTGSDPSPAFRRRFARLHDDEGIDYLDLGAQDLGVADPAHLYAAIYSNKVLHHLSPDEHQATLVAQRRLLTSGGVVVHSYWCGQNVEQHGGMLFHQYTADALEQLWQANDTVSGKPAWTVLDITAYSELGFEDSLCLTARAT